MKPYTLAYALVITGILSAGGILSAAPSLQVTKPSVTPNPSFTGPTNDPPAVSGQWFMRVADSNVEYRTHEFHDNPTNSGGGFMGQMAISGVVTNIIVYFGKIISFDIIATIANDTPATGFWADGTNCLNEKLSTATQYTNTLKQVILSVNFAVIGDADGNPVIPALATPPYRDVVTPYITTTNNDYTAWFCWTPETTNVNGYFQVPAWSLGDIPANTSTNRTLSFYFPSGGIPSIDPRYYIIMDSADQGTDIFINRSNALKISEWISDPALEDVNATNSNVSVFHNIVSDPSQVIAIKSIQYSASPPTVTLMSTGNSNAISPQVIQYCTNLLTTNLLPITWFSIATNRIAMPLPDTNTWIHSNPTGSVQFYRIIQP